MTGTHCAVAICRNSLVNSRKTERKIRYHRFPKDTIIRKQWIDCCHKVNTFNPDSSRICSDHFLPEDYERDLQAELLGTKGKSSLKKDSVPSIGLTIITPEEFFVQSQTRAKHAFDLLKQTQKDIVKELIETHQKQASEETVSNTCTNDHSYHSAGEKTVTNTCSDDHSYHSAAEKTVTSTCTDDHSAVVHHCNCSELEKECNILKRKLMKTEEMLRDSQQKLAVKNIAHHQLQSDNKHMKMQSLIPVDEEVRKKASEMLSTLLTKNQINILLHSKKRVNWSYEDLSTAYTLRCFSKRAYIYLRKHLGFPLPGLSTLERWASVLSSRQGHLGLNVNPRGIKRAKAENSKKMKKLVT